MLACPKIARAVSIHIVPYARGGDPIPLDVMKSLMNEGKVSYMKYTFRSCEILRKLDKSLGDRLFKFCGADSWTLRYLARAHQRVIRYDFEKPKVIENAKKELKAQIECARARVISIITKESDLEYLEHFKGLIVKYHAIQTKEEY